MPGGFSIGKFGLYQDVGSVVASSIGTAITPSASADTKGSYTQLIASTTYDACGLLVNMSKANRNLPYLVDIAVGGAGSEQIIIPDLLYDQAYTAFNAGQIYFPVAIPAGTRIAARCQNDAASAGSVAVSVNLMDGDFDAVQSMGKVTAYGITAASTAGTQVDPGGTANTKNTTYTQITSSLTYDTSGFVICFGNNKQNLLQCQMLFWLAVGAAASEVDIAGPFTFANPNSINVVEPWAITIPGLYIPSGTRISMTAASTNNSVGTRKVDVGVYGISA